jgi:hypothetical protein
MAEEGTAKGRNFYVGLGLEGDAGVHANPTLWPEIQSETLGYDPSRQDFVGLSGTRSHHYQSVADGNIVTGGGFVFNARKQWFDDILFWAMGGGNAGSPSLAETVKPLTIQKHMDYAGQAVEYLGCKITTLELASESNGPLVVTVTVVPMGVTTGVTADAATRTISDPLMMHHHLTLTIDGGSVYCNSLGLTLDNAVEDDHFQNSQSRTAVPEGDRLVSGNIAIDWNAANAVTRGIWTKFLSGATASLAMAYNDGTNTLTFTMAQVKYTAGGPPQADGRGTIPWEVPFSALSSAAGTQDEITAAWS